MLQGKRIMSAGHRLGIGLAGVFLLAAAAPTTPRITAGQIVSTSVDVTQPLAAPKVKLQIRGTANAVSFIWIGPSGEAFYQTFSYGSWKGAIDFQGYSPSVQSAFSAQAFNLYTEAGTWTLDQVSVCAGFVNCSTYSGTSLNALFGSLAIQVANPNPADIEPPKASRAIIETPTVSIANNPNLQINIRVSDNISGIYAVGIGATTPGVAQQISVGNNAISSITLDAVFPLKTTIAVGTATGTYTISSVYLIDLAGNSRYISDTATISKLFDGKTSFVITN